MTGLLQRNGTLSAHLGDLAAPTRNGCVIGPFGSDLKTSDFTESGVPVVFVQNVRAGFFDGSRKRFVSAEKAKDLAYHKVVPGDLVITKMGLPPCVAAIYPDTELPGIVTADIIKLSVDPTKADSRFVMHYLNSPDAKQEIGRITFGVTRPKVTLADFREIGIQLPPIDEQRRIAAILDEADAIRRKREEGIRLTEELLRSTFLDMFGDPVQNERGWPTVKVMDAGEVQLGRQRAPKYQTGKHTRPYIRVANVFEDRIDLLNLLSMDFDDSDYKTYLLRHGDILLNEGQSTELVGRPAMWRDELPACCFQNTLVRFRADPKRVEPEYALEVFLYYLRKGQFARISSKTSSVAHLGAGRFAEMPFPLPPLDLQQKYALQRRHVHKLIELRRNQICKMRVLFNSLVQRAFRGEL